MAYKALYRTYRPSTFDEVAGQQHIVKTLKNALATGKIAHAYLFCGPRGTGKTTMAKIFAKALNCEEGVGHQCNKCKNCTSINEGTHPDILEIDAASNRGINEIKDIIEKVKYATILGRKKVYIIDEVHMMTPEAFNALLKTLEEPPEHVVFILATTEPHKVLPTILSRCQRYDFNKLTDQEITERLKVVLEKEKVEYNDEAISAIVGLADGGMRDALSILDQVLAYSGNKLDINDILNIFALESKKEKISLINSILDKNVSDVLNRLNNYISKGSDIKRLTNDLLDILKDLLVFSYTGRESLFEKINQDEAKQLLTKISRNELINMIDVLLNASKDYKTVSDVVPLFEVTLLKLCSIKDEVELKKAPVETPKVEVKTEPVIETPKVVNKPIEEPSVKVEEKPTDTDKFEVAQEIDKNDKMIYLAGSLSDDHFSISSDTMIKIMVTSKKEIKNQFLDEWKNLKRLITHPEYGTMASLLIDAHPLVVSNQILIVEYQLPKMAQKANLKENQKKLQDIVNTIFGRRMFIYGVYRVESVNLQNSYRNLLEISKLPKANSIQLEFSEE